LIESHGARARWLRARQSLRKRLALLLMVAGIWSGVAGAGAWASEPGSAKLGPVSGPPKPPLALPSLDGPMQDLAQHRGRVVLVHFFATWCEPCGPELASLKDLQSRLAGQPFTILAISVAEADGAVRRFFARDPSPFAILLDRDRSIARAWSIQILPTTIVLDHQSTPRFLAEGDVNWARPDVMAALAGLLADVTAPGGG
jgi:peroxiredoxin